MTHAPQHSLHWSINSQNRDQDEAHGQIKSFRNVCIYTVGLLLRLKTCTKITKIGQWFPDGAFEQHTLRSQHIYQNGRLIALLPGKKGQIRRVQESDVRHRKKVWLSNTKEFQLKKRGGRAVGWIRRLLITHRQKDLYSAQIIHKDYLLPSMYALKSVFLTCLLLFSR